MNLFIVVLIWVASMLGLFAFIIKVLRLNRIPNSIAFFHPNCNAGGGGEYVLWAAVRAFAEQYPDKTIYIYTSGPASKSAAYSAVNRAIDVFGLPPTKALQEISLVHLTTAGLMFRNYRHLTLLFQSLGCFIAGIEAFWRLLPEIYVDTTGAAFTYPAFKLFGGCSGVAGYIHYPTIHSDMIRDVRSGDISSVCVSEGDKKALRKNVKIAYYKLMTKIYSGAGNCADIIMANGTWTSNHIRSLWKPRLGINIVYPPCKVSAVAGRERVNDSDMTSIISIGQFRPEKRHKDQVVAFHMMLLRHPELFGSVKLVLVGSTRGPADVALRESVREDCAKKGLLAAQAVEFPEDVNAAQKDLLLSRSVIGLHMMHDEHFGICVVEYMAAGVVPVAHESAGPKLDIVVPALTAKDCVEGSKIEAEEDVDGGKTVGMLANTPEEFAECLYALVSNKKLRDAMSVRAQKRAAQFSLENFDVNFMNTISKIL